MFHGDPHAGNVFHVLMIPRIPTASLCSTGGCLGCSRAPRERS